MYYYAYRVSSGEVISVSTISRTFEKEFAEFASETPSDKWPLYCDGSKVLTATAEQIATFEEKAKDDTAKIEAANCIDAVQNGSRPDLICLIEALAEVLKIEPADITTAYLDKLTTKT